MVDPMWEDWGRNGQIKVVRDMCRVCPTAGRSATGLVSILITAKMWHPCSRLNCIVSAHVALTASSIYAFCPFAARYFSASEREACVARRPSEVSGSEALAILMFLTNTLQRIVFHMFHA